MKKLQVLGTGCKKCEKLFAVVNQAAEQAGIEYQLEKVNDIGEIIKMGIVTTPALVVDGEIKVVGEVPACEKIKQMLI